jgi:hypothetical protein
MIGRASADHHEPFTDIKRLSAGRAQPVGPEMSAIEQDLFHLVSGGASLGGGGGRRGGTGLGLGGASVGFGFMLHSVQLLNVWPSTD